MRLVGLCDVQGAGGKQLLLRGLSFSHQKLFHAQGDDGIDAAGAPRRDPTSQHGRAEEQQANTQINFRVGAIHVKKESLQEMRKREGADQTDSRTDQQQLHSMTKDQRANLSWTRAEREANADLADALE